MRLKTLFLLLGLLAVCLLPFRGRAQDREPRLLPGEGIVSADYVRQAYETGVSVGQTRRDGNVLETVLQVLPDGRAVVRRVADPRASSPAPKPVKYTEKKAYQRNLFPDLGVKGVYSATEPAMQPLSPMYDTTLLPASPLAIAQAAHNAAGGVLLTAATDLTQLPEHYSSFSSGYNGQVMFTSYQKGRSQKFLTYVEGHGIYQSRFETDAEWHERRARERAAGLLPPLPVQA